MIELLRFVGIFNAAVWLGSAVLYNLAIAPSVFSPEMNSMLGPRNVGYFGSAIANLLHSRFLHVQMVCVIVAMLHAGTEWVYLGRALRKPWLGILSGLFAAFLLMSLVVGPRVRHLTAGAYAVNYTAVQRAAASESLGRWQVVSRTLDWITFLGVVAYFVRAGNPPAATRFVSAAKFRS